MAVGNRTVLKRTSDGSRGQGSSHGLGGRGLTRQGIGQTLLALNRTLPSLPGQNQRIEIQPHLSTGRASRTSRVVMTSRSANRRSRV